MSDQFPGAVTVDSLNGSESFDLDNGGAVLAQVFFSTVLEFIDENARFVSGPTVAVAGDVPVFLDTSGSVIADSGVLINSLLSGPTVSVVGNLPSFSTTTGARVVDSGLPASLVVQGPTAAVASNLAAFNGASGVLLQDSGIAPGAIVSGPTVAVSGNVAIFSGTTGRILADGGFAVSTAMKPVVSAASVAAAATAMSVLPLAGGTLTGALVLPGNPTTALQAAPKQYADLMLPLAGGTITGSLTVNTNLHILGSSVTGAITANGLLDAAGAIETGAITINGDQSLVNTPPIAPLTTNSSMVFSATTINTQTEAMISAWFTSNKAAPPAGGKVGFQLSTEGQTGSGAIWGGVFGALIDAGFNTSTTSATVLELDSNNLASAYGTPASGNGTGILMGGLGNAMTTAQWVAPNYTGPVPHWYIGHYFDVGSVIQFTTKDASSSNVAYGDFGTHNIGWDGADATYTNGAMRIQSSGSQGIWGCDTAAGPNHPLLYCNSSAAPIIGDSAVGQAYCDGGLSPFSDNAYSMGQSALRWTAVWAVNGTIQTSDPRLKTNITELPDVLPLVMGVSPKTFQWIDGGATLEDVEIDEPYHIQETTTKQIDAIEMQNGKPVKVTKTVTETHPAYDQLSVVDATGAPVMQTIPGRPEVPASVDQKTGKSTAAQPARAPVTMPVTHYEPRMGTRKRTVKRAVSHPGKRTHWGFMAPDLKAAFDGIGKDWGGYVKAEDGTEMLRPDQLIPVLWKAVQELAGKVAALTPPHVG